MIWTFRTKQKNFRVSICRVTDVNAEHTDTVSLKALYKIPYVHMRLIFSATVSVVYLRQWKSFIK